MLGAGVETAGSTLTGRLAACCLPNQQRPSASTCAHTERHIVCDQTLPSPSHSLFVPAIVALYHTTYHAPLPQPTQMTSRPTSTPASAHQRQQHKHWPPPQQDHHHQAPLAALLVLAAPPSPGAHASRPTRVTALEQRTLRLMCHSTGAAALAGPRPWPLRLPGQTRWVWQHMTAWTRTAHVHNRPQQQQQQQRQLAAAVLPRPTAAAAPQAAPRTASQEEEARALLSRRQQVQWPAVAARQALLVLAAHSARQQRALAPRGHPRPPKLLLLLQPQLQPRHSHRLQRLRGQRSVLVGA